MTNCQRPSRNGKYLWASKPQLIVPTSATQTKSVGWYVKHRLGLLAAWKKWVFKPGCLDRYSLSVEHVDCIISVPDCTYLPSSRWLQQTLTHVTGRKAAAEKRLDTLIRAKQRYSGSCQFISPALPSTPRTCQLTCFRLIYEPFFLLSHHPTGSVEMVLNP